MAENNLVWQSKLVLLAVLPFVAASVVLQAHWWAVQVLPVALWSVGLSIILGMAVYTLRTATSGGAFAGAVIAASLMFSTAIFPYAPWRTALSPLLALLVLSFAATRFGRTQKERLGIAEKRHGRAASQVAANLGAAALVSDQLTQSVLANTGWFSSSTLSPMPLFAVGLAALAEAAADTVSSEVGQVLGGQPRMITTLRAVEPGTDGAISLAGTLAGVVAAVIVSAVGSVALCGGSTMFAVSCAGGVFGLVFDSLLGATLERRGWLNNDTVNFLSTASASGVALAAMAVVRHLGLRLT